MLKRQKCTVVHVIMHSSGNLGPVGLGCSFKHITAWAGDVHSFIRMQHLDASCIISGSMAALLMQSPLKIRTEIWNFSKVPATILCRGIFNAHHQMPDSSPALRPVWWTVHSMQWPAGKTPGWQFIVCSGIKPSLGSSNASAIPLSYPLVSGDAYAKCTKGSCRKMTLWRWKMILT